MLVSKDGCRRACRITLGAPGEDCLKELDHPRPRDTAIDERLSVLVIGDERRIYKSWSKLCTCLDCFSDLEWISKYVGEATYIEWGKLVMVSYEEQAVALLECRRHIKAVSFSRFFDDGPIETPAARC
jgi:hypothetical protein